MLEFTGRFCIGRERQKAEYLCYHRQIILWTSKDCRHSGGPLLKRTHTFSQGSYFTLLFSAETGSIIPHYPEYILSPSGHSQAIRGVRVLLCRLWNTAIALHKRHRCSTMVLEVVRAREAMVLRPELQFHTHLPGSTSQWAQWNLLLGIHVQNCAIRLFGKKQNKTHDSCSDGTWFLKN